MFSPYSPSLRQSLQRAAGGRSGARGVRSSAGGRGREERGEGKGTGHDTHIAMISLSAPPFAQDAAHSMNGQLQGL